MDVTNLDADFLAFSGHKALGPSGTGALYAAPAARESLQPVTVGGATVDDATYDDTKYTDGPGRFEAGLQDVAGIIGFGAACQYLAGVGRDAVYGHEKRLTARMLDGLRPMDAVSLLGVNDTAAAGIVSFTVNQMEEHQVAMLLDRYAGVAVRSGMHCLHPWFHDRGIPGSVRASLHCYSTEKDVDRFLTALGEVAAVR